MKFLINTFLFFLFYATTYGQKTQEKIELGIPNTTIFSPNDYNAEAQSYDFVQDDKGVLYVANTGGFLEFNGNKWRVFKPDNEGMPFSFCKDSKGQIFTGGTGFIGYLKAKKNGETYCHSLNKKVPKGFKIGAIWDIFYNNGIVYFRNDNNILAYQNDKIVVIKSPERINNFFQNLGEVYFNTNRGLYKIVNNKAVFLESSTILKNKNLRSIVKTDSYKSIIVSLKNGLFTLENDKVSPLNNQISAFLKKQLVYTVSVLNDKNLCFSTVKGGVLFTNNSLDPIYRLTEKGGLSNNSAKKIKQDKHLNLWIGSDKGFTKVKYPITTTFYNYNPEKIGVVEEITSHNNSIFLGTSTGTFKLNSIDKNNLLTNSYLPEFKHLPNDAVENFANFSLGNKLLFSGYTGVHQLENNTIKKISSLYARKFHKSIYYNNILFMGHYSGLEIFFLNKNNEIIKSKSITGFKEIRGIAEDKNRNLWLTSLSNGVYKVSFDNNFENQKITQLGLKDGLPSLRDNLVYNINSNDVLFTTLKGLFKFDEVSQKFVPETRFGEKYKGGKDEFIYAFNFDKNENAWMHSFRNKTATAAIKDASGNYTLYEKTLQDIGKMQAYEILSEPDKNVVWFGGSDGLARFDISKAKIKKDTLFYAVISKVIGSNDSLLVGGHQFDKSTKTTLSSSDRDIRFEVGATDFTNLKDTEYQYFLEGYDKKWSDWDKEPFKIYTNLNYGDYTFKVRAKNYSENISIPDNYAFSILPFWYQTNLAKIFFFIIVLTLISYLANYFSKRRFVKKIHELELTQKYEQEKNEAIVKEKERGLKAIIDAQEEERSKIARELHDGVVQQIGSAILKSRNLFSKKNLIDEKESQELLQSLENSNKDLRNISHQMMPRALKELGIISALKDLLEGSLKYVDIQYSLEHFNIDERLPQKIEITIYRITQELINNIIKHSKANEVSVQLFNTNNSVILIVEDNGVGFSSPIDKKGIGLLNISSRLDLVKGDVNFEPSPKSGTLVTIKIPL